MFGNLTISNGNSLYFKKGEPNSSLTSPHATELITFLEEIEHKFVSIFDWQNDVMPYATMLTHGIKCTYDLHSDLFKAYPEGKDDPNAKYVQRYDCNAITTDCRLDL